MNYEDDIEMYMDNAAEGTCYIESLSRTRQYLKDSKKLLTKLDEVIMNELDLALMGAEKAKSEILKSQKDSVRPIK